LEFFDASTSRSVTAAADVHRISESATTHRRLRAWTALEGTKMLRTTRPSSLAAAFSLLIFMPAATLAGDAATMKGSSHPHQVLGTVLAAQPAEIKARYASRRPAETLSFFEVQPGDIVIETLPGGGWYSGILHPYLGASGKLIGAHYPRGLYERFGWDQERLQSAVDRDAGWPKATVSKAVAKGSEIDSFTLTEMPDRLNGTASKVLFIRSLHNLNRFGKEAGYLDKVLAEAYRVLKPGGIAGVVQHRAPESASEKWADGSNGYLKQSTVIAAFEAVGFKLVEASEINANPNDRPAETDNVWRLPPSLRGVEKNSAKWQEFTNIGESDRMTLKFVKPPQ
jgi:predicted methyltransferase